MPDVISGGGTRAFVPILFTRPDGSQAFAFSPSDYITLEFEGWTPSGALPTHTIVSQTRPEGGPGPFLWVQTGMGEDRTGFTFWIEDGL